MDFVLQPLSTRFPSNFHIDYILQSSKSSRIRDKLGLRNQRMWYMPVQNNFQGETPFTGNQLMAVSRFINNDGPGLAKFSCQRR